MDIEKKVKDTISKYKLCNKKEKILVALSGGKDSAVLAYILKKLNYNIEGIHINLGMGKYSEECLRVIEKTCKDLKINLHVYYIKKETGKEMLDIIKKNKDKKLSSCTMCGVFKKWILNKKSRELKADKIATGHHLDDETQTFMMNILKGSPKLSSKFSPILKIKDKKFVPRIKPLFFVQEIEIEKYAKAKKLLVVKEVCPYRRETYRLETRKFLKDFSSKDKDNLMNNFIKISKKIKTKEVSNYCSICGEPCRGKICKRCQLI